MTEKFKLPNLYGKKTLRLLFNFFSPHFETTFLFELNFVTIEIENYLFFLIFTLFIQIFRSSA
ncbi:hypothetical protein DERF_002094 [Dermatophagoides farinae]|uniref:Uncharacterized protein n=1 Tax=Dermatophagoides farinae TaxID=6954 RepID=A0A922IG06_DERFA|nr:hypothetical protein DERF_002094 [Dermatophagoides farinae]